METVIQRLERLYNTDNWSQQDKEWLIQYLEGDDISELYLISVEGFSKDALEKKITLDKSLSDEILSNIHQRLHIPKQPAPMRRIWIGISIAASLGAVVCTGYLFRKQLDNWMDPVKYEETVTARGELKMIQLADGTSIWLNAGSRITYPDKFKGQTREVTLVGEAYFKVEHDAKPFIIHSGKINTQVLGTSFNVKAYAEDKTIKVAVLTGKVGIIPKTDTTKRAAMLLKPNMQAVFTKTSGKLVSENIEDASSLVSWYQGKLQYHNTPLPEVLADVQRKYNVVIKADKNLQSCTLYANFNNFPLEKVLKLMSALINAHAVKDGDGYRLKGKGCK